MSYRRGTDGRGTLKPASTDELHEIARRILVGQKPHGIARGMRISIPRLKRVLEDERFRAILAASRGVLQAQMENIGERLDGLLPLAVDTYEEALTDGPLKLRVATASDVLDRRGFPKQSRVINDGPSISALPQGAVVQLLAIIGEIRGRPRVPIAGADRGIEAGAEDSLPGELVLPRQGGVELQGSPALPAYGGDGDPPEEDMREASRALPEQDDRAASWPPQDDDLHEILSNLEIPAEPGDPDAYLQRDGDECGDVPEGDQGALREERIVSMALPGVPPLQGSEVDGQRDHSPSGGELLGRDDPDHWCWGSRRQSPLRPDNL